MWEWLATQAQSASPFVATFCLVACVVLWRKLNEKDAIINAFRESFFEAMTAAAVAMEKGSSAAMMLGSEIKNVRSEVQGLRSEVNRRRR